MNQSPPFKLEHVELEMIIVQELIVHLSVMDAIFCCCCPRSLTLNLQSIWPGTDFEEWSQIVKVRIIYTFVNEMHTKMMKNFTCIALLHDLDSFIGCK